MKKVFFLFLFVVFGATMTTAQIETAANNQPKMIEIKPEKNSPEEKLAQASRAAIVSEGISQTYFDKHFRLIRLYNSTGDRRLVWLYTIGEYQTNVVDTVGFYTDDKGRRVDTHSIKNLLVAAREITKTISRAEAETKMRECIGEFDGGSVIFQSFGAPPKTGLYFSAVSVPPPAEPDAPKTPEPAVEQDPNTDKIRQGGKRKPFLNIGSINLETGECVKGKARSGAPVPQPDGVIP